MKPTVAFQRYVLCIGLTLGVSAIVACAGAHDKSGAGGVNDQNGAGGAGGATGAGSQPGGAATIALPIEVFGIDGTIREVSLPATEGKALASRATKLLLTLHNVRYATKASVQVNDSEWIALRNETTSIAEPARSFGGIGGGFAVLSLTVDVPAGALRDGANTVRFRFDKTNGLSMGYRVLGFNFLDTSAAPLLAPSVFMEVDPGAWSAPVSADPARGQSLWSNAALREGPGSTVTLRARCGDCHAQDGRDLKYFGYSSNSVIERAKFHGLTVEEGVDIAAYIHSLGVAIEGRPWNPPFQPGVGRTAAALSSFSAGAGLGAVSSEDATLDVLFQAGFDRSALADGNALRRIQLSDVPVGLQLPDWNHWLPEIHPKDSAGAQFDDSDAAMAFGALEARLAGMTPTEMTEYKRNVYNSPFLFPGGGARSDFNGWRDIMYDVRRMVLGLGPDVNDPPSWNDLLARQVYSTALWSQVKTWELMSKYGVEDYALVAYPKGESRAWFSERHLFDTSPFLLGIRGGPGDCPPDSAQCDDAYTGSSVGNTRVNYDYLSNSWYHLQLMLNGGQRGCGGHRCTDFGYAYGFLNHVVAVTGIYEGGRRLLWGLKAMEERDTDLGPTLHDGFSFATANPLRALGLDDPAAHAWWTNASHPNRRTALSLAAQVWVEKLGTWSAQQWRDANYGQSEDGANFLDGSRVVGDGSVEDRSRSLADNHWSNAMQLRAAGLHPAIVGAFARFGLAMWPANDWSAHAAAAGGEAPQRPSCTTEGSQVRLAWTQTAGATSYNVHRAASPDGPWLSVALLRGGSSYVDAPAAPGATVYYTVSANDVSSESAMSTECAASLP